MGSTLSLNPQSINDAKSSPNVRDAKSTSCQWFKERGQLGGEMLTKSDQEKEMCPNENVSYSEELSEFN
jgi:hypothetical protein